ncbi:hypothetical protein V6N13_092375 [Hibiscus sabdariffa]
MGSNKSGSALLLVAMAAMLLFATAPTVTAARNDAMSLSIIPNANIRNPLADIFFVESDTAANDCLPSGSGPCFGGIMCCSGKCFTFPGVSMGMCV